jgi:hypothetical protein
MMTKHQSTKLSNATIFSSALLYLVLATVSLFQGWTMGFWFLFCILCYLTGKGEAHAVIAFLALPTCMSGVLFAGFIYLPIDVYRIGLIMLPALFYLLIPGRDFELKLVLVVWALFFAYAAISSLFVSLYPNISVLKASFSGAFILLLVLLAPKNTRYPNLLSGLIAASAIGSLLFYFYYPSIGYSYRQDFRDFMHYAGMFRHPQSAGALLGLASALVLHNLVNSDGLSKIFHLATLISLVVTLYLSASRIGALTLISSSSLYVLTCIVKSRNSRNVISMKYLLALGIIAAVSLIVIEYESISKFVMKGGSAEGYLSLSGRSELVLQSLEGFYHSPIIGNGFQVPSIFTLGGADDFIYGDGTSIEKSFSPVMILEETGIIGAILFASGLILILQSAWREHRYLFCSTLCAFMILNFAEACVFAPSGLGGLSWILVFSTYPVVENI